MSDAVSHPKYYNQGKIEVIEFIEDQGLNFARGNAIKYISRAGKKKAETGSDLKKEIEDLKKAHWYIAREIEVLLAKQEQREAVRPNDLRWVAPSICTNSSEEK